MLYENVLSEPSGRAKGGEGAAPLQGRQFRAVNISTTPIEAPIYTWPQAAIPPAPPLNEPIQVCHSASTLLLLHCIKC